MNVLRRTYLYNCFNNGIKIIMKIFNQSNFRKTDFYLQQWPQFIGYIKF